MSRRPAWAFMKDLAVRMDASWKRLDSPTYRLVVADVGALARNTASAGFAAPLL